jgi:hypothetical protein
VSRSPAASIRPVPIRTRWSPISKRPGPRRSWTSGATRALRAEVAARVESALRRPLGGGQGQAQPRRASKGSRPAALGDALNGFARQKRLGDVVAPSALAPKRSQPSPSSLWRRGTGSRAAVAKPSPTLTDGNIDRTAMRYCDGHRRSMGSARDARRRLKLRSALSASGRGPVDHDFPQAVKGKPQRGDFRLHPSQPRYIGAA